MDVERLSGLDVRLTGQGWGFAAAHRRKIEAHWQALIAQRPQLWNGDVLICVDRSLARGVLRAELAVTDYASFLSWRDWGTAETSAWNLFGCPVVLTSDRAMIFGEMAANTMNGGKLYPPSGSLEPRDVNGRGDVDVLGSIAIELQEETGLDAAAAQAGQLLAIHDGHRIAVCQALKFTMTADEILSRFAAHRDAHAELARLHVIRSAADTSPRMPGFAQEIVRQFGLWFGAP